MDDIRDADVAALSESLAAPGRGHHPRPIGPAITRRAAVAGSVGIAGLASAPLGAVTAQAASRPATVPAPAHVAPPGVSRATLEAVVRRALGPAVAHTGVTVVDRRTGARFSLNGGRQVQMASTAKVLILVAFLRARRAQGRTLTSADRSLVQSMIRYSNNDAASTLWRAAGGRTGLSQTARACGLPTTAASAAGESRWGKIRTTSNEQATLLSLLAAGGRGVVPGADAAYVLSEMRKVTPGQAWGAGIVRSGAVSVAVKNGWAPLSPDYRWRVNSLGVVRGAGRDYVIAMYEDGLGSQGTGIAHKNAVARAVHAALATPLRG